MKLDPSEIRVAIVGAGLAGASCAAGLRSAGVDVTVFDKSRNVGGRMATRHACWSDDSGVEHQVSFDHGAQSFTAVRPRFRATMARAIAAGAVLEWRPLVHASRSPLSERCFVSTPAMPALCGHLLAGSSIQLNRTVRRLQRTSNGDWYVVTDDAPLAGPYQHVVIALPPAQAAVLLAGHQDAWAAALIAKHMDPCWTLMAVTDEVDWPWDAAEPDRGPFAWVSRNDRVPGQPLRPEFAVWTAHATAEWSAQRLEAEPMFVKEELQEALKAQLPACNSSLEPVRWHHATVHRWRYAGPRSDCDDAFDSDDALWDESLGVGVCGDWLSGGGVEAAWHSGDELADHMAASFERVDVAPELESAVT